MNKLDKDTFTLFSDIFEDFTRNLIDFGLDEDEAHEYGSDLYRSLDDRSSKYGVINSLLVITSAWDKEIQKMLFNGYLHAIFVDVYKTEIQKDAKKMLYLLSDYSVKYSNLYLSELISPIREYARDIVLLNAGMPNNQRYIPKFTKEDKPLKRSSESVLDRLSFADILSEEFSSKADVLLNYLKTETVELGDLINAFYALSDMDVIHKDYKESLKRVTPVARFLTRIVERSTAIDKKSVALHKDGDNAQARRKTQITKITPLLFP